MLVFGIGFLLGFALRAAIPLVSDATYKRRSERAWRRFLNDNTTDADYNTTDPDYDDKAKR